MTERLELPDIQALLTRGYGNLPHASFLLLHVDAAPAAAAVLRHWADRVTSAETAPADTAINIALTADGIAALAGAGALAGFSEQFTSGMTTTYRSRLLGDVDGDDPQHWYWGGPNTDRVHVLVLLYASSRHGLAGLTSATAADATGHGFTLITQLDTLELSEREHFGFHDGISQPLIEGLPRAAGGTDVVRAGEFVLGYLNEYGQRTERARVAAADDPDHLLPRDADGTEAADLGHNGSYLVFRQVQQDVQSFRDYVSGSTAGSDGSPNSDRADLLAAKMVGRWPSGAPLVLDPEHDNQDHADANDFGYHATDPHGWACPIGSHIRRTNPRDSLEPQPGTRASLAINHRHRILRRGRNYAIDRADGVEKGLYFIGLNANLARQYEFIQHSWVNDPAFNLLYDATDPLVGVRHRGGATFAVQARPSRRRYLELPQFVHVRGGAYFFLPGIRALRYLASGRTPR